MFDTRKTAKKIREARIARNMTQMDLADAMGVSYQAVSNWERGNSMPDISKFEDLCRVLQLEVTDLLGMGSRGTAAVTKFLQEDAPLTPEELAEVAPILPPEEVKKQSRNQKWNLSALVEIAPFLEDDDLKELVLSAEVESLKEIVGLAPFLEEETLDALVRRAPKGDHEGIMALAPFLEEETLNWVVRQYDTELDGDFLTGLAPFLGKDTLRLIVKKLMTEGDLEGVKHAAPFL